jgi:sulfur carrier protein
MGPACRAPLASVPAPRHVRPIMATTTAPAAAAAATTISVSVNGEARELPAPITVAELLARIGLDTRKVAVERNMEIVPRSTYAATALAAGDALEIVHFIGGG